MSSEIEDEEWAELTRDKQSPIKLKKPMIVIGRSKDCDVKVDSRLVSGHHCYLERNDLGIVFLRDTSTNGTIVNKSVNLTKGKTHQLSSGDEIFLVFKKDDPETNISFTYKETKCLSCDNSGDTLEYSLDLSKENAYSQETVTLDDEPESKRQKREEKKTSVDPRLHSSQEAGPSVISTPVKSKPDKTKEEEAEKDGKPLEALDLMEENLTCSICQELFHDCISLQPCMHCFCAGCYSPWMKKTDSCPQCRIKVIRISKNHIVNNLVEAFVKKHPDKKRPDTVTKELDEKNKISRDMLHPQVNQSVCEDYESEDSYLSGSDESDGMYAYNMHNNLFPPQPLPLVTCRQCPKYNGPHKIQPNNDNNASTSTADINAAQTATPRYVCNLNTIHAYCQCCAEPMPDFRRLGEHPQQCSRCYGLFCHMYWGCRKNGCNGCLSTFGNMNFGDKCLNGIINENYFESKILTDYLESHNLSWRNLLQSCIENLESGTYSCNPEVTAATVLCYRCALATFRQLAYLYRKAIPDEDLPVNIRSRPNCYWGYNCRTQKTRQHHAANFNHICEQTKFT